MPKPGLPGVGVKRVIQGYIVKTLAVVFFGILTGTVSAKFGLLFAVDPVGYLMVNLPAIAGFVCVINLLPSKDV